MPIAKIGYKNGEISGKNLKITDFNKLSPDGTKSVTFLTKQHLM